MRELIGVAREIFILIAGIAITQFFTSGVVVDTDPAFKNQNQDSKCSLGSFLYGICYMLPLIIIVTLILRFLFGSYAQMTQLYDKQVDIGHFHNFVTDVCFLMFFGAFLVGAALAKTVRDFMGWLALTSAAGILWSLIALWREDPRDLPHSWLAFNTIQLVIFGFFFKWCKGIRTHAIVAVVIAGVSLMVIYVLDLQTIYAHLPKEISPGKMGIIP